jgi:membrane associated rhomboid family serine protease
MTDLSPQQPEPRDKRYDGFRVLATIFALMWIVDIVDVLDNHKLEEHGIRPRDAEGLQGILFAPFLHANLSHIVGNSVPFIIFGTVIALSGAARILSVTLIAGFISGMGTWLVAPSNSLHIGMSGVIFGYGTYLISRGVFEKSLLQLLVGAVIGAMYGGVLLGGLEPQQGISWQGHLFGAVGGVVAAWFLAERQEDRRAREKTAQ